VIGSGFYWKGLDLELKLNKVHYRISISNSRSFQLLKKLIIFNEWESKFSRLHGFKLLTNVYKGGRTFWTVHYFYSRSITSNLFACNYNTFITCVILFAIASWLSERVDPTPVQLFEYNIWLAWRTWQSRADSGQEHTFLNKIIIKIILAQKEKNFFKKEKLL
jgi:hypothetical protein